ncbi:hypothetical protein OQA88_8166 [Cercophora sp. LCS_1]
MHLSATITSLILPTLCIGSPLGTVEQDAATRYIVKFKDNISDFSLNQVLTQQKPDYIYTSDGFKGFASTLDAKSLNSVQNHQDVEFVEEDAILTLEWNGLRNLHRKTTKIQANATWGLARISSRTRGKTDYRYDDSAGEGTCVYVIDTGVETSHHEFGGRVIWGINTVSDDKAVDGNGHGTAVAGVIGSETYGVAKKTTIIAVKVLGSSGSGTTAGVIAGMDWVVADAATRTCPNGVVACMAVGSGKSNIVNAAARAIVNAGVSLAVVAGSSNDDAAHYSPGSEPLAFTVGASMETDEVAWFSNYGEVLDMFAPGVDITSTWIGNDTETMSGTTMATAHAAGLGAYLLGLHGKKTPADLGSYMQSIATKDVLVGVPVGTKNLLAYNGIDEET